MVIIDPVLAIFSLRCKSGAINLYFGIWISRQKLMPPCVFYFEQIILVLISKINLKKLASIQNNLSYFLKRHDSYLLASYSFCSSVIPSNGDTFGGSTCPVTGFILGSKIDKKKLEIHTKLETIKRLRNFFSKNILLVSIRNIFFGIGISISIRISIFSSTSHH